MACDIDQTVADSACFQCLSDRQLETVKAYLLCQILSGGGIGGGGLSGSGSPEGVETASPGTTYLDVDADSLWVKKTGEATNTGWIQLIA